MDNDKNVLLSVKDLAVKFRVRGRVLTAIRGISLDIYENESIAIVGESGSGKSVFTKTFAGMLEGNGFISEGSIVFNDPELAETNVSYGQRDRALVARIHQKLNLASKRELGAATYDQIRALEVAEKARSGISAEEEADFAARIAELQYRITECYNVKQTLDPSKEKVKMRETSRNIADYKAKIRAVEQERTALLRARKVAYKTVGGAQEQLVALRTKYEREIAGEITPEMDARNARIAKEIHLTTKRYVGKRRSYINGLLRALTRGMTVGVDLYDEDALNAVFDTVVFRVRLVRETETMLYGTCVLNLAKIKYPKDWTQIRGSRIATVFQDPMTSLNPIITIGKQITSVILKHQRCSESEARLRAISLMKRVGIPNAEQRFDDYPFQYSGGMRQRIVMAIALSCQPKILICDEPTTALDVTIQAQILALLKELQKEFNYTIVFITHDLGVVANIADRVAVLYAGQIVELGTVEDVFYDPRHPYTWALLSSLPQLSERNTELFSISGTPPSLYNNIVGDPFAPRNDYCMKIDTLKEPPMFRVSDTHYAKTWLLDPRSPTVEKPQAIRNIHEKLLKAYHIGE